MNKKILLGALLASISCTTLAQNPSFDYVDIGYTNWDPDNSSSIDGFELKGSKSFTDNWYIAGDYNRSSQGGNAVSLLTAGVGYKINFSDKSTFFAEADFAYLDADFFGSENGYELTTGIRSMLTNKFELKGALEYLDINNDSTTSLVVGGVYKFTDTVATYLDYKTASDVNRLAVGVRFNF